MLGQCRRLRMHRRVRPRQQRIGGDRDVAVDVAAGGEGVDQCSVDRLHGRLELGLDHAMELERLARSDAQAALGEARGDRVQF
ncbi:hypothetical protein D9M70_642120 [compost metagenome]